jgi:cell division protein FtsQ
VKRPEGFDQAASREPAPKRGKAPRARSQAASPPAPAQTAVVHPPEERPAARPLRPDREARMALRRAARERRRYERLEVRRFTRRLRARKRVLIVAGGVVVVLAAVLLIAVYSPVLALREVRVEGVSRLDPAQIEAAVTPQLGTPLALLDFDEITDDLSAFPLIESYTTETVPPGTLVIAITERTAIGAVQNGETWDRVDPAGVVIESSAEAPAGLPVISAGAVDDVAFRSAVHVLLDLPKNMRGRVTTISATTADDVAFVLEDGTRVVWGSDEESDVKARALRALIRAPKDPGEVQYDVSSPRTSFFTYL